VNVDWYSDSFQISRVFSCQGLFHKRRVILLATAVRRQRSQEATNCWYVLNVSLLIAMPRDAVNAVLAQDQT